MRNYDTTNHRPYPRVTAIFITYAADGTAHIEYVEQMAVLDGGGTVQHLSEPTARYELNLGALNEPVQVVNPATGQVIPGQTVAKQQLMLGLLAFLRADQLRRDAEAEGTVGQ